MENFTGRTIQALRSDNGGEYTSQPFREFCHSKGVNKNTLHHTHPSEMAWPNDVITLYSTLHDAFHLIKLFQVTFGEKLSRLQVSSSTWNPPKSSLDKTPNKLFSGNKPSVTHLRIFGSSIFVHISKTFRKLHTTKPRRGCQSLLLLKTIHQESVRLTRCPHLSRYAASTAAPYPLGFIHLDLDG